MSQFTNVFFIGIGGIGMSALARYFNSAGKTVCGYDRTPTHLTHELEQMGIGVHYADDLAMIPSDFKADNTLVVITPAIPKDHKQWHYFVDCGFQIKKRAEVLGIITKDTYCFAVAGTHGKTTTTSILGHILYQSGVDVTAFVGGIVENYHTNLIGSGKTVTVVEADEFDRSFLQLYPNMACITSMDADHLDIYGDVAHIKESFLAFADKLTDKNFLFSPSALPLEGMKVGFEAEADYQIQNLQIRNAAYHFDVKTPTDIIKDVEFSFPGQHNLTNALTALAMAHKYGISHNHIKSALASFKGVERRFSYQIKTDDLVYIDDYAHHPTEIMALYNAVKELYPNKKNVAVFQPHLFSRTRDFLDGFAKALSGFDQVLLLDIYPARELPIPGITSELLLSKIENPNKKLVSKAELAKAIKAADCEVILTVGAGDIGEMVHDLKQELLK